MKLAVIVLSCLLAACAVSAKKNEEPAPAPQAPIVAANTSAEESAKSADKITESAFLKKAHGSDKIAQAKHDVKVLQAAAVVQRANLIIQHENERKAANRYAAEQRNLLLNANRIAKDEKEGELMKQLAEHQAGIIAHSSALQEHRKSKRLLERLIRENRQKFSQRQRLLRKSGHALVESKPHHKEVANVAEHSATDVDE